MKITRKGETLLSIIIALGVFSIIFLGLIQILEYNKEIDDEFLTYNYSNILKNNAKVIFQKSDLSSYSNGDIIYINKDSNYNISLTTDSDYALINEEGINIGINGKGIKFYRKCQVYVNNGIKGAECVISK